VPLRRGRVAAYRSRRRKLPGSGQVGAVRRRSWTWGCSARSRQRTGRGVRDAGPQAANPHAVVSHGFGTLRAAQGNDAAADRLYEGESDARSTRGYRPTPWSARRLPHVASSTWRGPGCCSTPHEASTGSSAFPSARPLCSPAWRGVHRGWRIGPVPSLMSQMWPLAARLALSAHGAARPGTDIRRHGSFRRVPSGAGGGSLGKLHVEALATICSRLTSAAPQRHLSAPGQPCRHAAKA
jgi:hypothetical protein